MALSKNLWELRDQGSFKAYFKPLVSISNRIKSISGFYLIQFKLITHFVSIFEVVFIFDVVFSFEVIFIIEVIFIF